jgi:hypothetical protein
VTNTHESLKSDAYTDIFDSVINTLNSKDTQYTVDPIEVLSVVDLLTQIKIKAVRAQLTSPGKVAKLEDELLDIITYSVLTLKKVRNNTRDLQTSHGYQNHINPEFYS